MVSIRLKIQSYETVGLYLFLRGKFNLLNICWGRWSEDFFTLNPTFFLGDATKQIEPGSQHGFGLYLANVITLQIHDKQK